MTAILVCTHGNSAQELVKSAEMICGQQSNWETVSFEVGMDPDQLEKRIQAAIAKLDVADGLLCLTDLKGGTPFNVLVRMSEFQDMEILTGVNIPILLEAALLPSNMKATEAVNDLFRTGQQSMFIYDKTTTVASSDEDF
jgi:mannose/fructose/sorbose-specific phosphotransferase system IIA component